MTLVILKITIISSIICLGSQYVLGTNNPSDSNILLPHNYFEFEEKTYNIPSTKITLTVPDGWKGVNLNSSILISPDGLDIKTGENIERTPVFMTIGYFSLDAAFKKNRATSLEQYVQNMAEATKCPVAQLGTAKINEFDGYKLMVKCESFNGEVDNTYSYFFISNNKLVFIGLKGVNPYFSRYIQNFEESVKTIRLADSRAE